MITILNTPIDIENLLSQYGENSIERKIITILNESAEKYNFDSLEQLKFELAYRNQIVKAANELYKSRMGFAVFRKSRCNEDYWIRTAEGGFQKRDDVSSSDAINDIFNKGSKYATECATAMVIVYYKALLDLLGEEKFNQLFPEMKLMNWHYINKNLKEIGYMNQYKDYLPGDRRYFENPDVDPTTMEWQGENVIDLGNGTFYGHGIGIHEADVIIDVLNKNRKEDAQISAYLMDSAGRPNFKKLFKITS